MADSTPQQKMKVFMIQVFQGLSCKQKDFNMSVISIFSGNFCNKENIINSLVNDTGFKLINEKDIIAKASRLSNIAESKFMDTFFKTPSIFNRFTHERERSIAFLRLAMAEILSENDLIITGFPVQLIPKNISHVLRICLIADLQNRVTNAINEEEITEKDALKIIQKNNSDSSLWVEALLKESDPWDASLYDIIIPTDKTSTSDAVALISKKVKSDVVKSTESSGKAVEDFHLSALVETALAKEGHDINVNTDNGKVKLTINKNVLMLSKLEEDICAIAKKIDGVKSVETKIGEKFHQSDIYRQYDFNIPSKVLLVDDEREFVQTLSERLYLRDMGSAVAFSGESALDIIKDDEPEVMLLDLKMPGIDGIEVLRKVKETKPEIEVIILTGHGSENDRKVCMDLGAFAYLHKPVDINLLSETLTKATEKMKQNISKK